MKKIKEYNDQELVELTYEEVKDLIDYQCALDGVRLLPPHYGPKLEVPDAGNLKVWKVVITSQKGRMPSTYWIC